MSDQSIAYLALDAQVMAGLADEPALTDSEGALTYAQLLHESAAIAGALRHFGVGEDTDITISLAPGRPQAIAILAAARLGAMPVGGADLSLAGDPPELLGADPEGPIAWSTLQQFGRNDPAPSREGDDPAYAERLIASFSAILTPLLQGRTIEL